MSIITGLLQNMAQNLTDEIGSGLQHTQVDSGKLANNISREMLSRTIETSINKIPIYIIVAHSSLDVNYSMPNFPKPGNEEVCLNGEHACFFTSNNGINGEKIPSNNSKKWLENQARFVYYPTPPGEAGGLQVCPKEENDRHILQNNIRNIRASILTGSNFLETLRDDGITAYGTEKTIASAFLPGSFIPDKKHQFFGDPLSFGGFGIIKLNNTGQNLDKSIVEIADSNGHILNNDGFFYASNTSEKAPRWIQDIAKRSKNEEEIPMSEIVREGGAGFYISLSCSLLSSSVYPNCNSVVRGDEGFPLQLLPMPIDERGETVSLYTDIAQFHDAVIGQFDRNMHGNNLLWQDFFKKILPDRVSRGKETLQFSTFGDFSGEGYNATTRRKRQQRERSGSVARTRGIIARNEDLADSGDYLQYIMKYDRRGWKPGRQGLRKRKKRRPQRRPQYQEQEPSVCKPNSTNAACILGATAVGAKLGGIKGACVGAACGAAMVGTKRLLKKKKEKINGGRRKKTKKQRKKKSRSRRRKRTRRKKH
jgi:hypothetical protein